MVGESRLEPWKVARLHSRHGDLERHPLSSRVQEPFPVRVGSRWPSPHHSSQDIYVMRNPKDVCVSTWYHVNYNMMQKVEKISWEDYMYDILIKRTRFADWFDHVLGWWKHRDSPNILYVKYENMKNDPLTTIRTVAKFKT